VGVVANIYSVALDCPSYDIMQQPTPMIPYFVNVEGKSVGVSVLPIILYDSKIVEVPE